MTDLKQRNKSPRYASDSDRELAGALIGGAFGFIGLAIFASASYAEKVDPVSLWWGNFAAMFSVFLLMLSIIFGGWGWTRQSLAGFLNPFNLQAVFGLLGVLCLSLSAGLFALNPRANDPSEEMMMLSKQINVLNAQLDLQGRIVNHILDRKDCSPISLFK